MAVAHADTSAWSRGLSSLCADACAVLLRPRGVCQFQHERVTSLSPILASGILVEPPSETRGSGRRLFPALFANSDWRAAPSRCAIGHLGFSFPWPGVATCFSFHKLVHKVSHHQSDRLERHRINLLRCALSNARAFAVHEGSEGDFQIVGKVSQKGAGRYDRRRTS